MSTRAVIVWQHADGRRLAFNHPDAVAERHKALAKWAGTYPLIFGCPYCRRSFKSEQAVADHIRAKRRSSWAHRNG